MEVRYIEIIGEDAVELSLKINSMIQDDTEFTNLESEKIRL